MTHPIKSPKKLIEVALPLDAINAAAAREKSIRHGHPSTLHLWWARRPLAAARAVIFAQLVNDPGFQRGGGFQYGMEKKRAAAERKRLFKILEDLVKWENTTNEEVLEAARAEIRRSWREVCELNKDHPQATELFDPEKMPGLHDPFAGGGAIPLEAQRLGLEAFATDLNPVAVLINKAMIEIPPRFAGRPPVHPDARRGASLQTWSGAEGLAEDVRHYGAWIRQEAERRIGRFYPKVTITAEMAEVRPDLKGLIGEELTVIAWLWARTVRSPNPAFSHVHVPLVSSFVLSSMGGRESWVEPVVDGDSYHFSIQQGTPPADAQSGTKATERGAAFRCILSGSPIPADYIKQEGQAGRIGMRLLAVVGEGNRTRIYVSPTKAMEDIANLAEPESAPAGAVPARLTGGTCVPYGMREWRNLFTSRQLLMLTTFSDLVGRVCEGARRDAAAAGLQDDDVSLDNGGRGARAYGEAVSLYLSFLVSKLADAGSTLCTWDAGPTSTRTSTGRSARVATVKSTFSRQALPMTWDFAESNVFSSSVGSADTVLKTLTVPMRAFGASPIPGWAKQSDARSDSFLGPAVISTDPPYYDNISYADLSDFFYVWLRRSLRPIFPELFATVAVPKSEELVATPHRHGSRELAERYFLEGMTNVMRRLAVQAHPALPVTIYYAFKQSETRDALGTSSTGWETFLDAVLRAGFSVTGTWPVRTERGNRVLGVGSNALASSIVLVCRRRSPAASVISRREFIRELNGILPQALDEMTKGLGQEQSPVAPVDLSQAILGPGMAVFSKYDAVLEADGSPMSVRTALQLINRFLVEDDFDHDTQFCLSWFDQYGWADGAYGEADVLARAKATSVSGLADAGVVKSGGGKVRLLRPNEYPSDWDPRTDSRIPVWEALHQLIRSLRDQGESSAGHLLGAIRSKSEAIRQLAYRLYTLCERQGWADDARAYNELVTSWSAIESAAGEVPEPSEQLKLFGGNS